MTHLCYTLEEAAQKLNMSETVLVRLSQYFKVPATAYESVGYLSFKGDLSFSDQDISFFRQVKERLLDGESLEEVKQRIRAEGGVESTPEFQSVLRGGELERVQPEQATQHINATGFNAEGASTEISENLRRKPTKEPVSGAAPSSPSPMLELQNELPLKTQAEKDFQRYKGQHHAASSKVFQKMLKEVGPTTAREPMFPTFKPVRPKAESLHKVQHPTPKTKVTQPVSEDQPWEHLLEQATSRPRQLNAHLRASAQLLKEQRVRKKTQTLGQQS